MCSGDSSLGKIPWSKENLSKTPDWLVTSEDIFICMLLISSTTEDSLLSRLVIVSHLSRRSFIKIHRALVSRKSGNFY